MTGVTSSRDAATATCATAVANSSAGTTPDSAPISGIDGYSSTGIDSRVKLAEPQLTEMRDSSVATRTGAFGSRPAISARRRPETSTVPVSSTSAWISVCEDTS